MIKSYVIQREREGLRKRLPLLRRAVPLERVANGLAERGSDGRQVPQYFAIQLLYVEPREVG